MQHVRGFACFRHAFRSYNLTATFLDKILGALHHFRYGVVVVNVMKAVTILAVLLTATQTVAAQDKAQIERGLKVYADQKCSACHSIAGKGNQKGALDDVGSRLSADEIRTWIVNPAEMTKKMRPGFVVAALRNLISRFMCQ